MISLRASGLGVAIISLSTSLDISFSPGGLEDEDWLVLELRQDLRIVVSREKGCIA